MKYVNLGCGNRYFQFWTNIDYVSTSEFVLQHDLNKGIPIADSTVDVVYHSHVLEHFSKQSGEHFISECFRVLKPGGLIRIVIPDLEGSVRQYLRNLESVLSNDSELNRENYEWSVIELFDQMIRNETGGEMAKYWTKEKLPNEDFIVSRVGYEFKNFRKNFIDSLKKPKAIDDVIQKVVKPSLVSRIKSKIERSFFPRDEEQPHFAKIGRFRSSGEIHQWMYDRYSLSALLHKKGFKEISMKDAFNSSMVNWQKFSSLDLENGEVRKPDSLFMEAIK